MDLLGNRSRGLYCASLSGPGMILVHTAAAGGSEPLATTLAKRRGTFGKSNKNTGCIPSDALDVVSRFRFLFFDYP